MSSLLDDDFVYNQDDFDFTLVNTIDNNSESLNILRNTCVEIPIDMQESISLRRQLLEEAADIVDGDRNKSYGKPENSYGVIAKFWSIYLDKSLEPHDVAAMMVLMKLARIKGSNGTHKDSWVDIAGYAACGYEVKQSNN